MYSHSTADWTSLDPDLWARITGAITSAEAEEGRQDFVRLLSRFAEGTDGGTVLKDSAP